MIKEILEEKIIIRDTYISSIFQYWNTPIIKVITWMRRAWKSYILKSIIQKAVNNYKIPTENIFFVDKELFQFDNIINYKDLDNSFQQFLKTINKDKKIIIVIDEVQEIQKWEKIINSYLTQYWEKVEIFITWSNSTMLSSELSTLLSWRYIEFEIFSLSLEEYSIFTEKPINKELFEEYLQYGWLPRISYMRKEGVSVESYLRDIYSTIILKDIIKYFWIRNIDFFEDLYKYLFVNVWNIVSSKSISDYLKSQNIIISPDIILNYISYWTKVYMLNKVKSVAPDTKKFFIIYNKYYVWDLWLRNAIIWYNRRRDIAKLLENYVFLELKRNGYEVKIWRLKSWKEIDFIATKNWIIKYFQVCYLLNSEETIEREYWALEELKTSWEKYIISMDETNFWISDWIKHIHVLDLYKVL
jgi:predicted AAA+ superfamily ATPase